MRWEAPHLVVTDESLAAFKKKYVPMSAVAPYSVDFCKQNRIPLLIVTSGIRKRRLVFVDRKYNQTLISEFGRRPMRKSQA